MPAKRQTLPSIKLNILTHSLNKKLFLMCISSMLVLISFVITPTPAKAQAHHPDIPQKDSISSVKTLDQNKQPVRIDLFVRGSDSALWHKWYDGNNWSNWESLGGVIDSAPSAASWAAGRFDVFGNHQGDLWHIWFTDGHWSSWENLGHLVDTPIFGGFTVAFLTSAPAVTSWGPHRLDIFAFAGNWLIHKWFDNGWHDWEGLGTGLYSDDPAVTSPAPHRLEVFVP